MKNIKENQENSNNVNHLLPPVFQVDKQWAVAMGNGKILNYTLSYTRKAAIDKFMKVASDKLTWRYFRRKYGYTCKKVTSSFQNGW